MPDLPPLEEAPDQVALDAWLRRALGRQLVIAILASPEVEGDTRLDALASALAAYQEIRLLRRASDATPAGAPTPPAGLSTADALLRLAAQVDADIVLIWRAAQAAAPRPVATEAPSWEETLLARMEDIGLRDRAFVALVGPAVTRSSARALGFADGFADEPVARLAAALATEAVRRDEYRRRGSSPPCFL